MKLLTNNSGEKFIDYKNSIETKDPLEKLILIRWWKKKFINYHYRFGYGYYLIQKKVGNKTYCMMIDMGNGLITRDCIDFGCYYHLGMQIKEEDKKEHYFIEKDITNSSLDELYKLYKQGIKKWENHLKNFVTN